MEQIKPPVNALDDTQLENVSGGMIDPMVTSQLIAFGLKQGQDLAAAFTPLINELASQKQYGKAMEILATYNDNTKYTFEEKVNKYVESWNKNHSNDPMDQLTASCILGLSENPTLQAQVACAGSVKQINNAIVALQNSLGQ